MGALGVNFLSFLDKFCPCLSKCFNLTKFYPFYALQGFMWKHLKSLMSNSINILPNSINRVYHPIAFSE